MTAKRKLKLKMLDRRFRLLLKLVYDRQDSGFILKCHRQDDWLPLKFKIDEYSEILSFI